MSNATFTQGNLALAMPAAAPRPRLTVIEGGKRERATPVVPVIPQRAARAHVVSLRTMGIVALAAALIAAALGLALLSNHRLTSAAAAISYEEVTVAAGDSLWSLAESHPAAGLSTDDLVQVIQDHNGLERAGLTPGQVLLVPAR